jgi:hypothetical protein
MYDLQERELRAKEREIHALLGRLARPYEQIAADLESGIIRVVAHRAAGSSSDGEVEVDRTGTPDRPRPTGCVHASPRP